MTPTPWEAEPNAGRGAWIRGATGEWAALSCGETDENADANAKRIVQAVNSYEAMRGALAFAASCIKSGEPWTAECERIIGGALKLWED